MGPHPGPGGKPRPAQGGGTRTLGHAEEEASALTLAPPCSARQTSSLGWLAPWGPRTQFLGGKRRPAKPPTWVNLLSHMTPFESEPHTWMNTSGFPAATSFPRECYSSIQGRSTAPHCLRGSALTLQPHIWDLGLPLTCNVSLNTSGSPLHPCPRESCCQECPGCQRPDVLGQT